MRKILPSLCYVISAVTITSCASILSTESPTSSAQNGLVYFMPKKDFLITVTKIGGKFESIVIGTTAAYPDLSTQYVLKHGANVFGKDVADVGVNQNGLLTSAKSTTESGVKDALEGVAKSAADIHGLFSLTRLSKPEDNTVNNSSGCSEDRTYTFIYKTISDAVKDKPCGLVIEGEQIGNSENIVAHTEAVGASHAGIFYRQNQPFLIRASGPGAIIQTIVFSPSLSKTYFMPISRTFFSNNEAQFSFEDGMPTSYKQDTEGELVALFKLPADIIGAYFGAVGELFTNFKTKDESENAAITASLNLENEKRKYKSCIAAIQANNQDLITSLGCQ